MNDPLLEVQLVEEESAAASGKLERTHGHAMAAMSFTLGWQSENARHEKEQQDAHVGYDARVPGTIP